MKDWDAFWLGIFMVVTLLIPFGLVVMSFHGPTWAVLAFMVPAMVFAAGGLLFVLGGIFRTALRGDE